MNRALVLRVASAVGRYVEDHVDNAHGRGVVVAYDGRHGPEQFAIDSVEIPVPGYQVYLFDSDPHAAVSTCREESKRSGWDYGHSQPQSTSG